MLAMRQSIHTGKNEPMMLMDGALLHPEQTKHIEQQLIANNFLFVIAVPRYLGSWLPEVALSASYP
jgi:hypothetical protein